MKLKGTITAYNARKGWGFIKDEMGNEKQFFHVVNSPGFTPELGIAVEFEIIPPFRLGQPPQAANLRKVESGVGGVHNEHHRKQPFRDSASSC